jgi:uncharacterized protein (DUF4415 family)
MPTAKKRSRTNWARINALKDEEIDASDIPAQGEAFFTRAILSLPDPKTAVTIRSDRQVLNWFKAQKADIREGDEILTVNGTFLGDDPFAWGCEVNAKSPSTTVEVQVIRSGSTQRLQLVLESPK